MLFLLTLFFLISNFPPPPAPPRPLQTPKPPLKPSAPFCLCRNLQNLWNLQRLVSPQRSQRLRRTPTEPSGAPRSHSPLPPPLPSHRPISNPYLRLSICSPPSARLACNAQTVANRYQVSTLKPSHAFFKSSSILLPASRLPYSRQEHLFGRVGHAEREA